jgi:alkanesulfonate monooxygenase SsuD/methylene tetrahydromethanopterin reductase-like flavin-dependent oxidoreductase (luciferase family)
MTDVLFGLDVPTSTGASDDPVAEAVNAEALGFDFVSSSDHPCGDSPSFETWTMLTWMAASTSHIRIASRVLGVPYRPPAMVAKMAESLQRLSNGRLILGLGGGASDNEFRAFGLTVPSPRDKVDGLAEAIEIARGLWSQQTFTYQGRLYHTDGAQIEPKPVARIPIWLGTFGPRSLTMTGRLADGWIPSLGMAPPEQVPAMREHILAGAREAGRDLAGFTYALNMEIRVDEHADIPGGVTGSADAVTEQLVGLIRLGFTALNFKPNGPDRREQVERLARQVVPAVRSAVAQK